MKKDTQSKPAQHTPGPWIAAGESIITKDDKYCIAVIESDGGYEAPEDQCEGNAHLIAAAPELLEALESIARILNPDDEESYRADDPEGAMDTAHSKAIAAIDRARGEKS